MEALVDWIAALGVGPAIGLSLAVNLSVFCAALLMGDVVMRVWRTRPVAEKAPAVTRTELALAASCVVLNSVVMVVGWALFVRGVVRIDTTTHAWRWIVDALLLLLVMDLAMYVTHRIAHHPLAYRWIHGVHHRYDRPRPLTLFVLHPVEVLGFGGLWIAVLAAHPFSLGGMMLYLTLNTTFGVLGHTGVEPLSPRSGALARIMGTSTFHARHHDDPTSNYGFYTTTWDRLFRTLGLQYDARFGTKPPPR